MSEVSAVQCRVGFEARPLVMAWRRVRAGPLRTVIGERLFCRTQGASGGLRAEREADGGSAENVGHASYRLDTRRGAAGSIIPSMHSAVQEAGV